MRVAKEAGYAEKGGNENMKWRRSRVDRIP